MSDSKPSINITRGSRGRKKKNADAETDAASSADAASLPDAIDVAEGLAQAGRNVWLAGLGALSMAEEAGAQAFSALVDEGKAWEKTRRETTASTTKQLQEVAGKGTQVATDAAESVETRIRSEVDSVLKGIGVPRREDMDALRTQVGELNAKIDRIAQALEAPDTDAGDDAQDYVD